TAARDLMDGMDEGEKVETLNANPRLGERRERISPDSRAEQSGLGPTRSRELERVNEQYEGRFGFRFVVFVNRRPRAEVLAEMRSRMGRSRDHELEEGLRAVLDIAEDRL